MVASQAVSWEFWARPGLHLYSSREEFHVVRRLLILSRAEAPEDPVQGGEYHASPSVGLQAPLVVLVVVSSLPEDSGAEEDEEAGGESTGVACTTSGVEETAGGESTGVACTTSAVEETAGGLLDGDGAVVIGAIVWYVLSALCSQEC